MSEKYVESSCSNGVATVTLNRPPLNVMNIEMMEHINEALLELRGRQGLKLLVMRGSGRAFSAGVDIEDHTKERVTRMLQVFHRIFETMRLLDVVSVAAVDGIALGGGFELAIGCSLIVASDSARFGLPEINVGVFPPLACVVLPRMGPRRKAMEWILTGEEISAAELERYGLVNRVLPADRFEEGLEEFIDRLRNKSAPVMQLAKRAQLESYYAGYEEALYKVENLYLRELMALEDTQEGIKSFLEKREPEWTDK